MVRKLDYCLHHMKHSVHLPYQTLHGCYSRQSNIGQARHSRPLELLRFSYLLRHKQIKNLQPLEYIPRGVTYDIITVYGVMRMKGQIQTQNYGSINFRILVHDTNHLPKNVAAKFCF